MRRITALVVLLSALVAIAAPQALAAKGPKDNDTRVQLLAFNDFHGHLEPTTPGTIQVGCCVPNATSTAWTPRTVPAGGVEYFATHLKGLRTANTNTITVGAGDLIGASPLISGLFHDEPAIHSLNALGLDVSGVGNHEFDEGLQELYRMQFGGCTADDHCAVEPFPGAIFQYLAANVVREGTDETILPAYEIRKIDNAKVAFIGLTLEATPTIVTPSGVAGLEFKPEVATTNALVEKLRNEQGVRAFVVLLHQGGFQNPPAPGAFPGTPNPDGYTDVNRCVNFGGPEIKAIAAGLDSRGRRDRQRPHPRAVHLPELRRHREAPHERVVVRSRHHGHRPRDRPPDEGREVGHGPERDRDAGRREGPGPDGDRRSLQDGVGTDRERGRRRDHRRHHAGLRRRECSDRRVRARRCHCRRAAEGDTADGLRCFRDRVHEPGRDSGRAPLREVAGW